VAVLWIGLLAGLILTSVNRAARLNMEMTHTELATVQAHWLARAGVEQALALLEDDDPASDTALDWWYQDVVSFQEVPLGGGTFSVTAPMNDEEASSPVRYGLVDLCSRLNVNAADEAQLAELPEITPPQVDGILDWRDEDENARPGGAERGYYQRLNFPYEIRNGPFQTLHELRLVRDIDDSTFFGEDVNLNGQLDPQENDGDDWPPMDDGDGRLTVGLAAIVTVFSYERNRDATGQKRVDMNQADQQTLEAELNLGSALAKAVVDARGQQRFETLAKLLEISATATDEDRDAEKVTEFNLEWLADHVDRLTLSDKDRLPGCVNINTASRQVLLCLPQMTEAAADAIVSFRQSREGPFEEVGWLMRVEGIDEELFKAIFEKVTVRSQVFRIDSEGVSTDGVRHRIIAVVDRGVTPAAIVYWQQGS
jgi:general secretion pathway protein K